MAFDFPTFKGGEPNCSGTDPESFFVPDGQHVYTNAALIERICASCPVLEECKEYAITHAVSGYWGGTTDQQRGYIRLSRGLPWRLFETYGPMEPNPRKGVPRAQWGALFDTDKAENPQNHMGILLIDDEEPDQDTLEAIEKESI